MEEVELVSSVAEPASETITPGYYKIARGIGVLLGLLPLAVIIYAYRKGIGLTGFLEWYGLLFLPLHLVTTVVLFYLIPRARWLLLAMITFDTLIFIVEPIKPDFGGRYLPITWHMVWRDISMRNDVIILAITMLVYSICFFILAHPKLGRFLAGLARFHRTDLNQRL